MTGHEMASIVLHTGGGVPLVQPLVFNQEGGYYEATITAIEVVPYSSDQIHQCYMGFQAMQ